MAAPSPPRGVVLDLRGNRGGLLGQAVAVADAFLEGGEVARTEGRHPEEPPPLPGGRARPGGGAAGGRADRRPHRLGRRDRGMALAERGRAAWSAAPARARG
jgi:carboxyl-terminal processing protease